VTIYLKKEKDIELLKISGKILADVLHILEKNAKEGTRLSDLDTLTREEIEKRGGSPSFLGYQPEGAKTPYPASICASINEQIVHGLPNARILKKGDVLKIDLGVTYKGMITDAAITKIIGSAGKDADRLLSTTKKALNAAIKECKPGNTLGDIGCAIMETAQKGDCTVIDGLTGHGVGFYLHEDPTVWNYGQRGQGMKLVPGLVIAIEPMLSLGSMHIRQEKDDSYVTKDKSLSAQFEKTIAITKDGHIVLTDW